MNALMLLMVQSFLSDSYAEEKLPRISEAWESEAYSRIYEPQGGMEHHEVYPWIGIEAMVVWTNFESGLHIKNAWGGGADLTITLDYGKKALLGFRLGVLGWHTRTEPTLSVPSAGVDVREYRIGIFGEFPFRFLEIGIGANMGGYRFRRDGNNDTAGFFEFEAKLGVRPSEFVWAGIVVMQTFTSSDFNHSTDHGYINYSIGPAVELRF